MSQEPNPIEAAVSFARALPGSGQLEAGMETGAADGAINYLAKAIKNCEGLECVALGVAALGVRFGGVKGFGSLISLNVSASS